MSERADERPRSELRGVEEGISEQDTRVPELRARLKPKTGPLPSILSVEVALELASGNINALQRLPSSGAARKRARHLCERIVDEGLLGKTSTTLTSTQPTDDLEPLALPDDLEPHALASSLELQASDLLVSATWIRKHTPGIKSLEVSSLQLYDGTMAARRLRSGLEGSNCACEVSVEYDLPRPGESSEDAARRADRNRRREEKALRDLDSEAAVEHRARKANEPQQLRVIEAAVADSLRSLVDMVCEQAVAWEPALGPEHLGPGDWAWIPPAGTSGPELVRIDARYRNGVLDITPLELGSCDFTCEPKRLTAAEGGKLLPLYERSQRFIGERVRVRYLGRVQGCYHIGQIGSPALSWASCFDRPWDRFVRGDPVFTITVA